MTRKEELEKKTNEAVDIVYGRVDRDGNLDEYDRRECIEQISAMLLQVEREVWEKVIAGYLRYKESLVPRPGCEKFPTVLLMSFEEWCRTQQQELT